MGAFCKKLKPPSIVFLPAMYTKYTLSTKYTEYTIYIVDWPFILCILRVHGILSLVLLARYTEYTSSILLLAVVVSVKASDTLIDGAILSLPQQ